MAEYSTAARPYARALFDVAKREGNLEGWSNALAAAAAVLQNPDGARYLARPELTDEERVKLIESLVADLPGGALLGSPHGKNLLSLLAENDRLTALPDISDQFDRLKAREENRMKVTLVSAAPVEETLATSVAKALEQKLGRAVELELEVDAELLGGAVIRAEGMVIDGSVRSRLERLTTILTE
jgi:F-type H+-transporting ATPase subunit delta